MTSAGRCGQGLNLSIGYLTKSKSGDGPPAYAKAYWFIGLVGLTGGFATVLTNSMGPMLDIYLLTQQLEPFVQIGTRAAFFTLVNTIKLVLFLWSGMLSPQLLVLGAGLGAAVGVADGRSDGRAVGCSPRGPPYPRSWIQMTLEM